MSSKPTNNDVFQNRVDGPLQPLLRNEKFGASHLTTCAFIEVGKCELGWDFRIAMPCNDWSVSGFLRVKNKLYSNLAHRDTNLFLTPSRFSPMRRKTLVLWAQAIVACAAVYVGQQSIQAQGVAPGGPGGNADWLPSNKTGVGTS